MAELWKSAKQTYVKRSTLAAYVQCLEHHILPQFGSATAIDEIEVQAFVAKKQEEGLSTKTIKDMLVVLKMVVRYGAKRKWLPPVDWEIKLSGESGKQQVKVLTVAHQKIVMEYLKENPNLRNLGIYISLTAGLRIGEVCALTWNDLDLENGVIHVGKTVERIAMAQQTGRKTRLIIDTPKSPSSIRQIPMSSELRKMVCHLQEQTRGSDYVLSNCDKPAEPRTYRCYYNRLMKQLGMPALKYHGLRHTFATRCIESQCDYKTVSVLLGHSSVNITLNLYVHPNLEQKQRCIKQIEEYLDL